MLTAIIHSALSNSARGFHRLANQAFVVFKNRRAVTQLSKLDDRMLADIGLTRSSIVQAKAMPLWRNPHDLEPFSYRRRVQSSHDQAQAMKKKAILTAQAAAKLRTETQKTVSCCTDGVAA